MIVLNLLEYTLSPQDLNTVLQFNDSLKGLTTTSLNLFYSHASSHYFSERAKHASFVAIYKLEPFDLQKHLHGRLTRPTDEP